MSTPPPSHPILLTPGPIEVDDDVLSSMSHPGESHLSPDFSKCFGETLTMLRKMVGTNDPGSQPFILGGSGSLGFDQIAANLLEPGDDVLVLNTGYWGDAFAECLETYGMNVDKLEGLLGSQPALSEIEERLREKHYKAITITHVDTVTGVLSDVPSISNLVRRTSGDTLIIVDGVCSIGSEDLRFDEWQLDVVLGASQKALGAPAGLSIAVASLRTMQAFQRRRKAPGAYYASWRNWLPVMRSYEFAQQSPIYFATPPTQLVRALHTSLFQILACSSEERIQQHKHASHLVKAAVTDLGLEQVATRPHDQAHGLTAFYLPSGLRAEHVLPLLLKRGVQLQRGPQKQIAGRYIRFAHMGVSVTDGGRRDIEHGIRALKETIEEIRRTQNEREASSTERTVN